MLVRSPIRRPIRAVFFDAGNTLFRESPLRWEIYAGVAREFGLPSDAAAMRAAMVRAHETLPLRIDGAFRYTNGWFRRYLAAVFQSFGADEAQLAAIGERLFAAFRDRRTFVVFPEVVEVLRALKEAGLRIGVISNWSPRLPALLEDLDLAPHFDFVLCSAIEEVEKPDREIFARALARAQVDPAESLHVGDSPEKDVAGARASGISAALVDRGDGEQGPGPNGDGATRIRDLRELLPLVDARLS